MNKLFLTIVIAFVATGLFAQEGSWISTIEGARPVNEAYRINGQPEAKDTIIPTPETKYPLLNVQQKTEVEIGTIDPAKIKLINKLDKIYNSYVKLGIGYPVMPLGEIYINSVRNRQYNWGIHAKHLSNWTKIKGYAPAYYDNNSLDLFGTMLKKKYSLSGEIDFFNNGNRLYGIKDEAVHKDSIRQRFNNIGAAVYYASRGKDSATFHYQFGAKYAHFMDLRHKSDSTKKRFGRENILNITSHYKYRMKNHLFSGDFNIDYNGYKYGETDTVLSNGIQGRKRSDFILTLAPEFSTFGDKWLVRVGAGLVLDMDNNTKFNIFPKFHFQYRMFDDVFIPYLGVTGGLNQTTFKSTTRENEFLLSSVDLKNEAQVFEAYLGFKGAITKTITFNTSARFGRYRETPFYVNDSISSNRFDIIYDTMYRLNAEASISYQLNEKIKVDFIGNYFYYMLSTEEFAWNRPDYQFVLRGTYDMFDKFVFNLDLTMQGGRKAKLYAAEDGSLERNGVHYKKLGFLADVNLGFEYRYSKRFSAFIQLNNLAAQKYLRYNNYPVQGFQILGGVTFKF
jgi:hypothetical protein